MKKSSQKTTQIALKKSVRQISAFVILTSAFLPVPLLAAPDFIYTPQNTTTNLWSTGTNWSSTPVSSLPTGLIFGPSGAFSGAITNVNTNDLGGSSGFITSAITLRGTGAAGVTDNVTINSSGINYILLDSTVPLGSPRINLNASSGSGGTLNYTIASPITLGTVALPLLISGNGTANFAITGVISGPMSIQKSGASTISFSGLNTYTGTTSVLGGTFLVGSNAPSGSAGALGNAVSAVVVGDVSGTANASLLTNGAFTIDRAITVQSGSSGLVTLGGSTDNNSTFSGSVGLGRDVVLSSVTTGSNAVTFGTGVISGAFGITKAGTGTVILSGANTYTGATIVSAGTLRAGAATQAFGVGSAVTIASGATLDLAGFSNAVGSLANTSGGSVTLGAGTLTTGAANTSSSFSGVISGTGGFVKTGTGTQTLNGASTYSGTTSVLSGTVIVGTNALASSAGALGNASSAVLLGDTGGLQNSALLAGGAFTIGRNIIVQAGSSGTSTLGSTANTDSLFTGNITLNKGVILSSATTGFITSFNTGVISGVGGITKAGSGIVVLGGVNTYTGPTAITAGTLRAGIATQAFGLNSAVTLSNVSNAVLELAGFNNTIGSLAGGGATGGNVILGAGTLTTGNTTSTSYAGAISGTGGLIKVGSGTQTLTGTNTYTGTTNINAGTLSLSGGAAIADAGKIVIADVAGATLQLATSETIGSLAGGGTTGGVVSLGSNTLTTGGDATSTAFAGIISGTGGLTKTGAGTMTLSGVNTYTGATTISGGTLALSGGAAISDTSSVSLTNVSGGFLVLNANETIGSLAGGGAAGGNVLLGINTLTTGGNNNTASYAGVISGTGGLTKIGSGTQTLTGTNIYTGVTTVNAGILALSGGSAIADTNSVVLADVAGAILQLSGTANETIGSLSGGGATGGNLNLNARTLTTGGDNTSTTFAGIIYGTGSFIKEGTGIMTLSGSNTYTGATTINGGTLRAGSNRAFGINSAVTISSTGIMDLGGFDSTITTLTGTSGTQVLLGSKTLTLNISGATSSTYAGVISGTGGIVKTGSFTTTPPTSTQTLTGANTYTGATILNQGTLTLGTGGSLNSSSDLKFIVSGTFNYNVAANTTQNLHQLALVTGDGTLRSTYGGSGTNTLNFSEAPVRMLGGTGNLIETGGVVTTNRITFAAAAGLATSAIINKGLFFNGSNYAAYDAAGYVRAYDYSTDTGHVTAAAGAAFGAVNSSSNVNMTGAISAQTTASINTLKIGGNYALTLAGGSTLTVDGILKAGGVAGGAAISGGSGIQASSNSEMVIRMDAMPDALTINTPILANGVNALTKSGLGTLTLSAANTYSGANTINAGIVQISASNNLGSGAAGNTITFNGGTLESTGNTYDLGVNRSIVLNATGTIQTTAGQLTVSGNVTDGSYGYSGGNLNKLGAGTLVLSGTNTYTGATTLTDGTLKAGSVNAFGSNSAMTLAATAGVTLDISGFNNSIGSLAGGSSTGGSILLGANTLTMGANGTSTSYAGVISGTGGLTKTGAGVQTLVGASTYTGSTVINGGTFKAGVATQAFGVNSAVTLANVAGAALDITGFNQTIGSLAGGGNAGGNVTLGSNTLTVGASNASTTYTGVISGAGGRLTKEGTGTLTLAGANTYTGPTTINQGTLKAGVAASAFGSSSAVTIANAANTTLDLAGFSNSIGSLSGGGATGGNVTLGSGTLTVGSGNQTGSYDGVISGTGGLTKAGSGTQTLTNTNTYTGATTISAGTLALIGGSAIADASAVVFGNVASAASTLTLNSNETVGSLAGGGYSGSTVLNGIINLGANTLTIGGDNTSTSFNGGITGSGGLTKIGTGAQTLNGINTYTGPTSINSGTVIVSSGLAIADSSAVVIANAASTNLQLGANETIGSLSGGGALGGNVILGANTLATGASGATTSYAGILSGTGGLTKTGGGTQTLTSASTYTGVTTIQSGTLALTTTSTNNLASSSRLIVGDTSASSSAVLDVTGVSNAAGFHVLSGQTANGFGTYNAGAGKTITVDSGATWAPGGAGVPVGTGVSVGANAVTGNLVLLGTTDMTLGTPGASHASVGIGDTTSVSGTLALGGILKLVDNAGTGTDGTAAGGSYKLFTQSGMASGSFGSITNIANTHAVVDSSMAGAVYVDLYKIAAASVTNPINLPSVHLGGAFNTSGVTVTNLSSAGGFSEGLNASIGTVNGSVTTNNGSIINGQGTDSTSLVVGLGGANTLVAGHKTGTVQVNLASNGVNSGYGNTALPSQTVTVNGDVFRLATPNTITSTVNLGYIHQGASFASYSVPVAITNGSVNDSFSEGLDVMTGTPTGDATAAGSIAPNLFGSSSAISVGLNTGSAGAKSGTVPFNFTSNGLFSVLANTALPSQTVTVTGQVYSGQGVWNTNGGGNWSDVSKWQTLGGSPGLDSQFQTGDSATFSNALTSGTATINLNSVSPSISALTFNNTNGASYAIAQGTGGTLKLNGGAGPATVTDSNGNHVISAPIQLDTNANILVSKTGESLTISGPVSGSNGITKTGAGMLVLSGADTYTGQTTISSGILKMDGSAAMTSGINVGAGGKLLLGHSNAFNAVAPVLLSGGTIDTGAFLQGTAGTGSVAGSLGFGTLSLANNSILDFSSTAGLLHFASSGGLAWNSSAMLSIYNWTPDSDRLFFGTTSTDSSLTFTQLAHILFYSDNGMHELGSAIFKGTTGELTYGAAPEPGTAGFALCILGLAGLARRKRRFNGSK